MSEELTREAEFTQLYERICVLCEQNNWGAWSGSSRAERAWCLEQQPRRLALEYLGATQLGLRGTVWDRAGRRTTLDQVQSSSEVIL